MAQNAISEELKFKIFLGGMPPDPPSSYQLPSATVGSYIAIYLHLAQFPVMKQ